MKKIIPILLMLVLLICSCKDNNPSDFSQADFPFCRNVSFKYGSFEATAELNCKSSLCATLKMTGPDELKGLVFKADNGEITASFNGASFPISGDSAESSVPRLIFSAVEKAFSPAAVSKLRNKNAVISGETDFAGFEFYFNRETGNPLFLSYPSLKFRADFS